MLLHMSPLHNRAEPFFVCDAAYSATVHIFLEPRRHNTLCSTYMNLHFAGKPNTTATADEFPGAPRLRYHSIVNS